MKRATLMLALAGGLIGGCAEPAAVVRLLGAADGALVAVDEAHEEIERGVLQHVDDQTSALDEAFVADMKVRADAEGRVALDDVLGGKALYDAQRAALADSRRALAESFARRRRSLRGARTLVGYARDLVIRNRAAWYDAEQYLDYVLESLTGASAGREGNGTP